MKPFNVPLVVGSVALKNEGPDGRTVWPFGNRPTGFELEHVAQREEARSQYRGGPIADSETQIREKRADHDTADQGQADKIDGEVAHFQLLVVQERASV